jgi:hypothetical protein
VWRFLTNYPSRASEGRSLGRTKLVLHRRARCNSYGLTFCDSTAEVLVVKFESPP